MSKYRITLDGKTYEMEVELVPEENKVQSPVGKVYNEYKGGADPTIRVMDPASQRTTTNATGVVTAPMPGTILSIRRKEGEDVSKGDVVLVLEAMKMENEITAPIDGKLAKISCCTGGTVAGGDELFRVE